MSIKQTNQSNATTPAPVPTPPQPPVTNLPPLPQPTTAPSSSNGVSAPTQGWQFLRSNPGTFADVAKVVNARPLDPSKVYNGGVDPNLPMNPGIKADFASNTVQSPASIVELARALQNNPQLIFEHVYNNIDWQPGWGVMKGALGCLMDGSGNAFDQSLLLAALLRQAGYTANIILGEIEMTSTQYDAWFGTNSVSSGGYCAYWYSQYANIPGNTPVWNGTNYTMIMSHVWVEVVISGNTYALDSSVKAYNRPTAVAVGGTKTTGDVMTVTVTDAGLSGGTATVNYTVLSTDTLNTISQGIAAAINANSSLAAIGVTAGSTASPMPAQFTIGSRSKNPTTYAFSVSSGATETLTQTTQAALLPSMMSYSQSTFLSDAESGATIDPSGNFVQNMNTTNIHSDLKTMTSNLRTYIEGNTVGNAPAGTAIIDDVLGGAQIVPLQLPFTYVTSLPYQNSITDTWTGDVPLAYKTTLEVQYPLSPSGWAIDETYTSDQLANTRLTLTFNSTLNPVLSLNGTVVATGSQAQSPGSWNSIQLTVTHNAYASPVYPKQWWQSFIYANDEYVYLIGNAWGNLGRGQADWHRNQLAQIGSNSGTSLEPGCGESLSVIWFNWAAQASRVADLASRMNQTYMNFFHQVGMVSNIANTTTSTANSATDIGGVSGFSSTLNYDFTQLSRTNTVVAMHGVALEAAALSQFTNISPGASTTTIIDKSNRTAAVTIGGTVTAGNTLTITVTDPALSGGSKSDTYTVLSTDTLTTIAASLAALVNADSALAAIGVTATSNAAVMLISSTSVNQTSYSGSTSGGATETITVAFEKIYLGTSSNWNSGVDISATLVANGYNSSDMSNIYSSYLSGGDNTVLIADHPNLEVNNAFTGWGDWIFPTYSNNGGAYGLINNVAKGGGGPSCGFLTTPGNMLIPFCTWSPDPNAGDSPPDPSTNPSTQSQGADPVGLVDGSYTYDRVDMAVGSQAFPYGLTFGRTYNSSSKYNKGVLGWGWIHNHYINANVNSDGLLAMGSQFAVQAAASIVELFVAMDLASDSTQPIVKLVTMSLAGKWWFDRLVSNVVIISFPHANHVFLLQPDGTYTAPAAFPSTLSLSSGDYTLETPQGVKYEFNGSGQISSIVYPAGVTISYTYSSGLLSTVSNGIGRTLTLNYTSGVLTSVTDGTGRSVSYGYDTSGDLTSFTDALTNQTTYQYSLQGQMSAYYLPANPTTAFISNTYDTLGRVETQANARGQVTTFYLAAARAEVTDPVGNTTLTYFNRMGRVIRFIDALGFETDYVYDGLSRRTQVTFPQGNQVQTTYNANNQILTRTFVPKPGSGLANIQIIFSYDPTWAKVKTVEDGNGNITTLGYDSSTGNLLTITRPTVGGSTPVVTNTYNSRGQLLTRTDETGIVTQFNYDVTTEKLTSLVLDYNTGAGHLNLTAYYGYDSVGNLTSITDFNSNQTALVFDNERKLTQKTDPTPFSFVTNFGYDNSGNLTSVQRQVTNTPTWQTTTIAYSVTFKKTTVTDPLGRVTTWVYDSADRIQSVTDMQNRVYQFNYDADNRSSTVTDSSAKVCDSRTYTNNGQLATIQDANSNVTQFSYDGHDRLSTTTYADTTTEQRSSYDANSNVLTYVSRSGNSITMTYDALNRLATKSPSGQALITYGYDLANRLTSLIKAGSGDPSTGTFQRFFDTAGRFYQEEYPDGKTVTHVLDGNGNRTKTTWPDGYYVTRSFDQLNRLTNIYLNGSATSAATFTFDQLSRRASVTLSNGVVTSYTYALNNDLINLQHAFVGSSVAFAMQYDNVHELISSGTTDSTFVWQPNAAGTVNYGTVDGVNKYPSVGSATFTYDGNKNLTFDGTFTYTFDTENHLLTATATGTSASYVYDPMNRQAQKTVGSTLTRFIYDGNQRIADYNGSTGALINRYVNAAIDEPIIQITAGGTVSFFHQDIQNSVIAQTNSSGAVTNKYAYGPFGEITSLSGTSFGYTGQRFDSETGLYYYKARYYSPNIGRFLQTDPIGYQTKLLNLYGYANNSPFLMRDSLGLDGTITIGNQNVTVSQIESLASQTRSYSQVGPAEDSMLITTTGATFIAPNSFITVTPQGYEFAGGAMMQYTSTGVTLGVISLGAFFLALGQVAMVIHTHQSDIPSPADPQQFSWSDIGDGRGVPYAQIVVTTDGFIFYKAPNSTSQTPDGMFDSNGGFHQATVDANGNVTYAVETSDPAPAIVLDGPPAPKKCPS